MSSTANQLNDLLQLAAQVGELSDRLKKAEGELASQSAPIGAAKASQDAGLAVLASAVEGIKALNFHVIDKNVSEVRARVDAVVAQTETAIKALTERAETHAKELASAKQDTAQKLAQTDAQRIELAKKRDEDAKELSNAIALVANESAKRLAELSEQVQKFAERPSIRPSGAWGAGKTCDKGDLVSLNGSSYISLVDGNTEKPSKLSKKWQLIAARGGGGSSSGGTGGGIEDAPSDGTPYARQDAGWVAASSSFDLAAEIHAATGKTTPADSDEVGASDSAASYALKKFTWANIKATLKTYFDAIYAFAANPTFTGTITVTGTGGAVLNNDSASAGAISSTGGGQFDITAPIQLSGNVKDSAGSFGTSGYALIGNGSGALTYQFIKRSMTLHFLCYPGTTSSSIGSTETFFGGNNRTVVQFDSTGFTKVRIRCHIGGTASNGTTTLSLKYYTTASTTLGDYLVPGASSTAVTATLNTTINATYTSGWIDLTAGAIGDVFWVLTVKDTANAAINPTFSSVDAEFR